MIALAAHDTARYSALCDDYEAAAEELDALPSSPIVSGPPPPPSTPPTSIDIAPIPIRSEFIDSNGKLSLSMMLAARLHWQAGTTTRSEKVSEIDSKYALARIARETGSQGNDDTEPEKMTLQEASNLTKVLQDQNSTIQQSKPRKVRELRWREISQAIQRHVNADGEYHLLTTISVLNRQTVLPNLIACTRKAQAAVMVLCRVLRLFRAWRIFLSVFICL
jgi:hypothetical protein